MSEISEIVESVCTPEQVEMITRLSGLLNRTESQRHLERMHEAIMIGADGGGHVLALEFINIVQEHLVYSLSTYGVKLNPDTAVDMEFEGDLLEALLDMEINTDVDTILGIVKSDEDSIEKLYKILTLTKNIDLGRFYSQVLSVSPTLLLRIDAFTEHLSDQLLTEREAAMSDIAQRVSEVMELALELHGDELDGSSPAMEFLASGALGYSLDAGYTLIRRDLQDIPPRDRAIDIFLITSGSDAVDLNESANAVLEQTFTIEELMDVSDVIIAMEKI